MRRKIRDLKTGAEFQVPENDAQRLIWGSAGLRSLEMLPAFNFPNDISGIVHIDFDEQDVAGSDGEYVVPLFHLDSGNAVLGGLFMDFMTSMTTLGSRNAADYFQSKGILTVGGDAFFYRKEPLPPQYVQAQMKFARQIRQPQTMGLRILADYEPVAGGGGLRRWKALKESNRRYRSFPGVAVINRPVTQRSLLVAGGIRGLYPETGVIEMRGSPTPWEATYRPSYFGQPAFGKNPDDVVEWLRYTSIVDGPYAGEDFHLLVGRLNATYNFRGYPERDDPSLGVDLRKQLDLQPQPIRLVMELSEGGAGYGDYVTIATRDPNIYEPVVRRVYKVLEHEDGRFFASLLDVGETGLDTPMSPGRYKNSYTMDMNPRLVKFPAWGLPEVGAATGLIFGDAIQGGGSTGGKGGRSNAGGVRYDEDEDQTGITLDEVKLLQNQTIRRDPRYSVRHVLVPLDGGTVTFRQGGQGGASISGRIPPGRAISRSSPLEVLVVTLSREPGFPTLFAQGEEEGVLRIGDELFYFEDPLGQGKGGGQVKPGIATLARAPADPRGPQPNPPQNPQDPNQVVIETSRERDPLARSTVTENLPTQNLSGHFEKEGFARMADERYTAAGGASYPSETFYFYEIFYYRRLQGGFATCLRGQFETPLLLRLSDQAASGQVRVHNVTRRLRLVGRGLLGTQRVAHSLGEGVTHVPYLQMQSITGPITNTGLPVKKAKDFAPSGYLLLDSGQSGVPWEICAHIGPQGEGLLVRPRDERGKGILRACFGTKEQPLSNDMFAYEMPYRYPDRYEAEADSESFAYLQKSYRVPGAYWRSLEWTERKSRARREHRSDIVVLARFDGAPEWDVKPTNEAGGLYLFEATDRRDDAPAGGDLNQVADQLEIRVYFRFPSGAFSRIGENIFTDDWKETPVLESLRIEYEKAGTVLRHEELPF